MRPMPTPPGTRFVNGYTVRPSCTDTDLGVVAALAGPRVARDVVEHEVVRAGVERVRVEHARLRVLGLRLHEVRAGLCRTAARSCSFPCSGRRTSRCWASRPVDGDVEDALLRHRISSSETQIPDWKPWNEVCARIARTGSGVITATGGLGVLVASARGKREDECAHSAPTGETYLPRAALHSPRFSGISEAPLHDFRAPAPRPALKRALLPPPMPSLKETSAARASPTPCERCSPLPRRPALAGLMAGLSAAPRRSSARRLGRPRSGAPPAG